MQTNSIFSRFQYQPARMTKWLYAQQCKINSMLNAADRILGFPNRLNSEMSSIVCTDNFPNVTQNEGHFGLKTG